MKCIRCGEEIPTGCKSVKYCSVNCSKRYLQAGWRKRHREDINKYNASYKKLGKRPLAVYRKEGILERFNNQCFRCGDEKSLHVHHIKPLRMGGLNEEKNYLVLCHNCHMLWHQLLVSSYWDTTLNSPPPIKRTENPKKVTLRGFNLKT